MDESNFLSHIKVIEERKYYAMKKSAYFNEECYNYFNLLSESRMFKLDQSDSIRVSAASVLVPVAAMALVGLIL